MTEQFHNFDDEHIPAPAEHSPRRESLQQSDGDLMVYEVDGIGSAWILAESGSVPVEQ